MELIRAILLKVEESEGFGSEVTIPGFTPDQVGYHNYLLVDAGLEVGTDVTHLGSKCREFVINDLTWAGHDFLDAAREPERWKKAQTIFSKMGGVSLHVAKSVLTTLMTQQANTLLGII
jgi:hypothetical protein